MSLLIEHDPSEFLLVRILLQKDRDITVQTCILRFQSTESRQPVDQAENGTALTIEITSIVATNRNHKNRRKL